MIHKFSLIAEFEYDDEGMFSVPSPGSIERDLSSAIYQKLKWLDLAEKHFEVANGSLTEAFGVSKVD